MVLVSFSVEIAGTAHIGVILDGTGPGGGWARFFVVGDEGFDALAGQAADFDGTRRDRFGSFIAEFAIKTQHAQAGFESSVRDAVGSPGWRQSTLSVCGPMEAAHLRNRSGDHSAYLRWELGIWSGFVP